MDEDKFSVGANLEEIVIAAKVGETTAREQGVWLGGLLAGIILMAHQPEKSADIQALLDMSLNEAAGRVGVTSLHRISMALYAIYLEWKRHTEMILINDPETAKHIECLHDIVYDEVRSGIEFAKKK